MVNIAGTVGVGCAVTTAHTFGALLTLLALLVHLSDQRGVLRYR